MPNPDGTSDSNAISLYETNSGEKLVYEVIDGAGGTAGLKITSRCANLNVLAGTIIGGTENCVDLNNECSGILVQSETYQTRGKYTLSAKTCNGVIFRGHIALRASQWEVNLGSWSDQSDKIQSNTLLALTADVYPIRVWVGNAEIPHLDDPKKYQIIGFGRYGAVVRSVVMLLWKIGKKLHLA